MGPRTYDYTVCEIVDQRFRFLQTVAKFLNDASEMFEKIHVKGTVPRDLIFPDFPWNSFNLNPENN